MTTVAAASQHEAAWSWRGKPWNEPHIIKYNYKKFKLMLRNTQLYISMYFQNHNLRHFGMVVVHFLCRGSLSFQKGYRKFFTYTKHLLKEGQLHYFVDLKANICSSPGQQLNDIIIKSCSVQSSTFKACSSKLFEGNK